MKSIQYLYLEFDFFLKYYVLILLLYRPFNPAPSVQNKENTRYIKENDLLLILFF